MDDLLNAPSASGTCAKVKIQLQQEATVTRTAFTATMEIKNDAAEMLQNVRIPTIYIYPPINPSIQLSIVIIPSNAIAVILSPPLCV